MTPSVDQFEEVWDRLQAGASPSEALGHPDLEPWVAEDLATATALQRAGREMGVPEVDRMWQGIATRIDLPARRRSRRGRTTVLLVAAAMVLGGAALLAAPASRDRTAPGGLAQSDGPVVDASSGTLDRAESILGDLARAARQGSGQEMLDVARELARLRRVAMAAGEEISSLDRLIRGNAVVGARWPPARRGPGPPRHPRRPGP